MNAPKLIRRASVRTSILVGLKVILSLYFLVFATNITVTTTQYQAENGGALNISGNLTATDKGFSLALLAVSAVGTSCSSPVTFGIAAGTANIEITAGHVVFDAQINSTSNAQGSKTFNVTFVMGTTTYGPLCVRTPALPLNGQTIDFKFDVGVSLPTTPYSYTIKVQ